jgi:hypothetical protein
MLPTNGVATNYRTCLRPTTILREVAGDNKLNRVGPRRIGRDTRSAIVDGDR